MSQGANVLTARGLETSRNELLRSEGSQSEALNVNIDESGVITPRRGFNDYGNALGGQTTILTPPKQIMSYKNRIIRHYESSLEFEDQTGNFQPISGSFNETVEGLRIKFQEANSNLYFTTSAGIKKISVKDSSELSSTSTVNILDAGAVEATHLESSLVSSPSGYLPAQSKVAYRYLFGYRDKSNNLILGTPSFRHVVTNDNQRVIQPETLSITVINTSLNNEYIILNSLNNKYVLYFSNGSTNPPRTALTIGGIFVEVNLGSGSPTTEEIAAILANEIAINCPEFTASIDVVNSSKVNLESKEEGDLLASQSSTANITISDVTDGKITEGDSVNVSLNLVVPNTINTDYFVQVYRTNFITVSDGLTLDDLDPGDEMNLVFEAPILQTENIDTGEFIFTDTLPESFRASNVPLYSNEITGEGILQTNDRPPVAQDISLFRNSTFYANTRKAHSIEIDLQSINDFQSSSTKFVIGNEDAVRFYTFTGTKEDVTITAGTQANTADSSYILINSANDLKKYYLWFDKTGSSTNPTITDRVGIRVNLAAASTEQEVADAIYNALLTNPDFDVETITNPFDTGSSVAANQVRILYTNNGYTEGVTTETGDETVDIGTGWLINTTADGTGELADTAEGGDVLLSALISVSQSIDETSRSLVKVVNKDNDSIVNAYYLSTSSDLPGKLRFVSKSLEDKPFYIAIDDPRNNPEAPEYDANLVQLGTEFNPTVPLSKPIERIVGLGTSTRIQVTGHGFSDGDEVYVSYQEDQGDPDAIESFAGLFPVSNVTSNNFTIDLPTIDTVDSGGVNSFDVSVSSVFIPTETSDDEESVNRLYYSKVNEPEAVPSLNFINIGAKDEPIRRILSLRDNLFVFKDDGVFIVSGTSAPNFSVRLLDNIKIIASDSAVVLNNQIYCLTEQGISVVTDAGVGVISRGIESTIDNITDTIPNFSVNTFGIPYENDRAYLLFLPKSINDTSSTQALRYNIFERTWTRWEYDATCGLVLERDNKLYLGNGDRNFISQERKNNNRTDFADREFTVDIIDNFVQGNVIKLSALGDVQVHDAITQTQEVSIYFLNRLLRKIDVFDIGLVKPTGSTYLNEFSAVPGDSMVERIQSLNDYLATVNPAISAKTINSSNLRQQTEILIDELNSQNSNAILSNYKKPKTVVYESYITEIDVINNTITVKDERPFLEDSITVYRHITKRLVWNPQHYGDPSMLKQVSYTTIMFDQNNFNEAVARFGSDVSPELSRVNFSGKGIGYWGDLTWSNSNHYFGGNGNDVPFRTVVPRTKQKCRYLTMSFEHFNAREDFRIVGVSAQVRPISRKAYR